MAIALDPFLVALYTIVDDLYQQRTGPRQPGRLGPRPVVSDSEVPHPDVVCAVVGPLGAGLAALCAGTRASVLPALPEPEGV